jgi:hypothetical protein
MLAYVGPIGTSGRQVWLDSASITVSDDGTLQVQFSGGLGDLLPMQTYLVTRLIGRERLRLCECGRPFVRIGKRRFCSERCQKRVYMKRRRAGEVGKE